MKHSLFFLAPLSLKHNSRSSFSAETIFVEDLVAFEVIVAIKSVIFRY